MAKTMLASGMTDGQIDDLANKVRDAARTHRDEIEKDPAQEGLRSENVGMRLFAEFRRIVEEISRRIVHLVTVNRALTHEQHLAATGRRQYVDKKVVAAMPRGVGDKVRLVYFKPGPECYEHGVISCVALEQEYEKLNLDPDLDAQADDNAADPAFADEKPNGCQWRDKDGNFCYAAFGRWDGERGVGVSRSDGDWDDDWLFAGVPK